MVEFTIDLSIFMIMTIFIVLSSLSMVLVSYLQLKLDFIKVYGAPKWLKPWRK